MSWYRPPIYFRLFSYFWHISLGKYMGILINRKYVRNKKINENKLVGGTTTWGTIWGPVYEHLRHIRHTIIRHYNIKCYSTYTVYHAYLLINKIKNAFIQYLQTRCVLLVDLFMDQIILTCAAIVFPGAKHFKYTSLVWNSNQINRAFFCFVFIIIFFVFFSLAVA